MHAEDSADEVGVRQAVLNYANSIYEMAPELLEGSVHPRLQKFGYWDAHDGNGYQEMWMSFDELSQLATTLNKSGMFDAATAKREVQVLGLLDRTAVARLDADWGVDFIELVKQNGEWLILNIVWQSYPAESE